jgi:dTDP-L-rhamnose 4-epimerase
MSETVLITGGAGFIGSHLADVLLEKGHLVRVLDNLDPQVHGNRTLEPPSYLNRETEFKYGDIRNREAIINAIKGVDVIYHLAAAVGVGHSMYQIEKYVDVNVRGTSLLLDALVNVPNRVRKLIVASSNTIYGEGPGLCPNCGAVTLDSRSDEQLLACDWELHCPNCDLYVIPQSVMLDYRLNPTSVYAKTKLDQEQFCHLIGKTYGIPVIALRFFNVYGTRQALSNPYTGIGAIFSARLLNNRPPIIYEDGRQSRDFTHVKDIVQACSLAMDRPQADGKSYNVGTGKRTTIIRMASLIAQYLGVNIPPEVVYEYRKGDIRHCFGDISATKTDLGYEPKINIEMGIADLVEWIRHQNAEDRMELAVFELKAKGLMIAAS